MMNFLKMMMSYLAVFSMSVLPLAQAEAKVQDQKERINEYLKQTGLSTGKMTVAEYWRMIRHTQPDNVRQAMDLWVSNHRSEMMPQFDAVSFKDADGNQQTRLTAKIEGRTHNFTVMGGPEPKLKIDNVVFTQKEVGNFQKMTDRLAKENTSLDKSDRKKTVDFSNVVMNLDEVSKLTRRQQAEYLYRLRKALQLSSKVMEDSYGKQVVLDLNTKLEIVFHFLLGEEAEAKADLTGKTCVVAGYISIYGGKSQSCGGVGEGTDNLKQQIGQFGKSCSTGAVPCNPLVYGFNNSGGAFCIPPGQGQGQVKYATAACNDASPMHKDNASEKARIIESYMNVLKPGSNVKLHPNEKGEIPENEKAQISGYLRDLNKLIDQSIELCTKSSEMAKIQVQRTDQKSACDSLMIRAFDLKTFAAVPEPPIELPPPMRKPSNDCEQMKPGSRVAADGKSCRCPEGTEEKTSDGGEEGAGGSAACSPIIIKEERPMKRLREVPQQNDCPVFQFVCDHPFLTIGGLAAIGGLVWWLWPRDHKCTAPMVPAGDQCIYPPVYTPPAGPLPPVQVCSSPAVLVGGVCQIPTIPNPPPVVVPPPAAPTEGGTTRPVTGASGGVR